jgi:hypothetical protein
MHDTEFRKIQEAIANLVLVKEEIAKGAYELFKAYEKAGFDKTQALHLVIVGLFGKELK